MTGRETIVEEGMCGNNKRGSERMDGSKRKQEGARGSKKKREDQDSV